MLKIGDFSKLSRISIRMLRHYDEIGLLAPKSTDPFTGYRYYSEDQLPLADRIHALKKMGFSLNAVSELLKTYNDPQSLKKYLEMRRLEVKDQMEKSAIQLHLLETTIKRLGKDEHVMDYSVLLKEMPVRTVASVRNVISSYDKEGILWKQMMQEIALQNVRYANPCYSIAIFHDKEYKEQNPDVEIQLSVQGTYHNTDHVVFKEVSPVLVASTTYKGGYDQISEVNQAVAHWVKANDYDFDGAMFNIYHVGPAQTQNPDEFVTEICFPVKKNE
jgi:DNA-binding transcriptional MerR regulator